MGENFFVCVTNEQTCSFHVGLFVKDMYTYKYIKRNSNDDERNLSAQITLHFMKMCEDFVQNRFAHAFKFNYLLVMRNVLEFSRFLEPSFCFFGREILRPSAKQRKIGFIKPKKWSIPRKNQCF